MIGLKSLARARPAASAGRAISLVLSDFRTLSRLFLCWVGPRVKNHASIGSDPLTDQVKLGSFFLMDEVNWPINMSTR